MYGFLKVWAAELAAATKAYPWGTAAGYTFLRAGKGMFAPLYGWFGMEFRRCHLTAAGPLVCAKGTALTPRCSVRHPFVQVAVLRGVPVFRVMATQLIKPAANFDAGEQR
jgi:hypothetical protein